MFCFYPLTSVRELLQSDSSTCTALSNLTLFNRLYIRLASHDILAGKNLFVCVDIMIIMINVQKTSDFA